jgi:hypothetical protein
MSLPLESPALARNLRPISETLAPMLPTQGMVLELASGPGEHAVNFARRFPALDWQPSDVDSRALESIAAYRTREMLTNLLAPIRVDLTTDWSNDFDAVFSAAIAINVCHISPWSASTGLLAGAARVLAPGAALFVYGPFKQGGSHTAPSNAAFDETLRARDSTWGVRDVDDLSAAASHASMRLVNQHAMPSNNLLLEFRHNIGDCE